MRILLHPGFHKTGTSSLQRGAEVRMNQLAPHLRLMLTSDVIEAARAARRYSARPGDKTLRRFAETFADAISQIAPSDPRALLISCEDLSGYIPGNHEVPAYDAAPALMATAIDALHAHFGKAARITVFYTTRAPGPWQRSVWYQNLRALRITEDFDEYRPRLDRAAQLDDIATSVQTRLQGQADVVAAPIESCGSLPLGPLGVALDHLEIDTGGLAPLPAQNIQPEGAAHELLALNRSEMGAEALAQAKRDVIKRHRRAGNTRRDPDQGA